LLPAAFRIDEEWKALPGALWSDRSHGDWLHQATATGTVVVIVATLPRLKQGRDPKGSQAEDAQQQLKRELGGRWSQKLTHP
jgi:hypothetical protein